MQKEYGTLHHCERSEVILAECWRTKLKRDKKSMSQVEWKEYNLYDICEVFDKKRIPLSSQEREGRKGDYRYYGAQGVIDYVNDYIFDGEYILLAEDGDNLKSRKQSLVQKVSGKFWVNNHAHILSGNGVCATDFLYYLLSGFDFAPYITGSAQPKLSQQSLAKIFVKIPPLTEQKRIAGILSSLDDKIELNKKINDNLEKQAQLLYSEMFIEEPDVPLGSVVITTSGGTPNRKESSFYTNGSICWVKSKELLGSFILDTEEKITEVALNKSAAKKIPANSVMIAMYGATVGEYGIISKEMTCNQAICALVENEKYPYTYLFMYTKMHKQELINMAVGSAQQNISQVIIKEMLVHSDLDKIQAYHVKTDSLFQEMKVIQEENQRLTILRDTLLPKLMSGESL